MAYAKNTNVSEIKSRQDIENTLARYGADQFGYAMIEGQAIIAFRANGRHVRFTLAFPAREAYFDTPTGLCRSDSQADKYWNQAKRSRWRALLLAIKAKLESVESGIEIFDEAFLGQIVMPNGRTVMEETLPQIEQAYKSGADGPLLLTVGN